MSQTDTPPLIKPYAGQLQDQDEKGSLWVSPGPSPPPRRRRGQSGRPSAGPWPSRPAPAPRAPPRPSSASEG